MKKIEKDMNILNRNHLILLIIYFFIQGCSGMRLGDELSKTFDGSSSNLQSEIKRDDDLIKKIPKRTVPINKDKLKVNNKIIIEKDGNPVRPISDSKPKSINKLNLLKKNKSYKTQPYRIIIRLSSSNTSAPGEAVTKALRQAGVEFEVERIEIFETNSVQGKVNSKRGKF